MPSQTSEADFELYYWPLPFRSCFITYLFAYRDAPLMEVREFDAIEALRHQLVDEQPIPLMGPPMLRDRRTGLVLSQMPAIVLHVSRALDLLPESDDEFAMGMKILMDCNDVLMEICRYNGSSMWAHEDWIEFRTQRFPRWLSLFEALHRRGHIGQSSVYFADIAVYALFGNMIRCLPELEQDLLTHAPRIHAHCEWLARQASMARYVAFDQERYGQLYCDGQIEQSIRSMLAQDVM
ncbi:MAG: hypothetical protein AAGH65_11890 [Pseudomonadota bacterium]